MKIRLSKTFRKDFAKLDRTTQDQAKDKFKLFEADSNHPSLRVKKMKGFENVWEAHISLQIVFTFSWTEDEETGEQIVILRRIGKHKIYDNP